MRGTNIYPSSTTSSSSSSSSSSSNLSINTAHYQAADGASKTSSHLHHLHHAHHYGHSPFGSPTSVPEVVGHRSKSKPVFIPTGFAARLANGAKVAPELNIRSKNVINLSHDQTSTFDQHSLHDDEPRGSGGPVTKSSSLDSDNHPHNEHDSAISSEGSSSGDSSVRHDVHHQAKENEVMEVNDHLHAHPHAHHHHLHQVPHYHHPAHYHHRSESNSSDELAPLEADNQNGDNGNTTNSNASSSALGSRISVVRWPQGSIPRRVKKLTWQDEQRNNRLDQMYHSNQVVPAMTGQSQTDAPSPPPPPPTKTKTLSGHLLTGTQPAQVTSYAIRTGAAGGQPINTAKVIRSANVIGAMARVESSSPNGPSYQRTGPKSANAATTITTTLPDLTVYF